MASTKSLATILASVACIPATPQVGTAVDLTTKYGALITGLMTNGGTGPTVALNAYVEVSGDNTNWKQFYVVSGGTVASAVTPFSCRIPSPVMYARVRFADNTGQNVTAEAFCQVLATV